MINTIRYNNYLSFIPAPVIALTNRLTKIATCIMQAIVPFAATTTKFVARHITKITGLIIGILAIAILATRILIPRYMHPSHAATFGWVRILRVMHRNGIDIFKPCSHGNTVIRCSAQSGRLGTVRFLLSICPHNPSQPDASNWTFATAAALGGHVHILELLQNSGVDISLPDGHGETLATRAAARGHVNILEFLRRTKISLVSETSLGTTPATRAARYGHVNVLQFLLESGIRLDLPASNGDTPATRAATYGQLNVLQFLKESNIDIFTPDRFGKTPEIYATERGHAETARWLQEQKPRQP